MQEWISLLAYTDRFHKPCYGRLFWSADKASWPLSPYNLTYFAFCVIRYLHANNFTPDALQFNDDLIRYLRYDQVS
jgi:hypothetical protein